MNKDSYNKEHGVSVAMITYNHENFIAEAIEGVLNQKCNFPLELIICDDASTDKTAQIIKRFELQYPNIIKAQYNKLNMGMGANFVKCLSLCKNKYIAICEGDDYWIDSNKLQIQVDFLESHPDYSGVGHSVMVERTTNKVSLNNNRPINHVINTYTIKDICSLNPFTTCSMLVKNNDYNLKPYIKSSFLDWPLWIEVALDGSIGYINQNMAVYRIHEGGVHSNNKQAFHVIEKNKQLFYETILETNPHLIKYIIAPLLLIENNLLSHQQISKRALLLRTLQYIKLSKLKSNWFLVMKIIIKIFIKSI